MKKADLIKEWVGYAHNDLRSAEHLTSLQPQPLEVICFHCQQTAEKALKAFLVSIDKRPPKTHDLYELITLCEGNEKINSLQTEAIALNDYSVITRYPGMQDISEKDKNEALVYATSMLQTVEAILETNK